MKEYQVTVYECEYCQWKFYDEKEKCEAHEKECANNPATKHCRTCKYLEFGNRGYICTAHNRETGWWKTCEQYKPREIK